MPSSRPISNAGGPRVGRSVRDPRCARRRRAGQDAQAWRARAARRNVEEAPDAQRIAERHHRFLRRRSPAQIGRGGRRGAVPGRAFRRQTAHGRLRRHADDARLAVLRQTAGGGGRQRGRRAHAAVRADHRGPQQYQRVRSGADHRTGVRRRHGEPLAQGFVARRIVGRLGGDRGGARPADGACHRRRRCRRS